MDLGEHILQGFPTQPRLVFLVPRADIVGAYLRIGLNLCREEISRGDPPLFRFVLHQAARYDFLYRGLDDLITLTLILSLHTAKSVPDALFEVRPSHRRAIDGG